MAVKRGGLGKGLDSLIPEGKNTVPAKTVDINVQAFEKGYEL